MRVVASILTHAEFLRLGPSLGPDGRLQPLRAVARVAEPLVWTAFPFDSDPSFVLLRPGCLAGDDLDPAPIGYIVCCVPWEDPDAVAHYQPPPPTVEAQPPIDIPSHVRTPPRQPGIPSAVSALPAPMRAFHAPLPPKDVEKRQALRELHARAVEREKRRYAEAAQEVARYPSIIDEARRRARIAQAGQAAIPPNLAPHVLFVAVRPDGTAVFLVRTPTFRASLRIHQAPILRALADAGFDAVRVEGRVGAFPDDPSSRPSSPPSTHRSAAALRESAQTVEDDALREQLLRLADAIEGRKSPPSS